MKTIGLMAFHAANNFGANLQIFSTYSYLKNHGFQPIVINYVPVDAKVFNARSLFSKEQVAAHQSFVGQMKMTRSCLTSEDVAKVIKENDIEGVVIGSDAIAQHHPFFSRIIFPSKRHIVSFERPTSDRMFPNAFWGEFQQYLDKPVPTAIISASNQQSEYRQFTPWMMAKMRKMLANVNYISARDVWTQKMYNKIFSGKRTVEITPDPVFAFNHNVHGIPSKEEILTKFKLPEKYILLCVRDSKTVSDAWVLNFDKICIDNGYTCVAFPLPQGLQNNKMLECKIELPLSPMDWYAIIRYASGFVGNNMHTIVSSLHNAVPLFCFDQYGIRHFNYYVNSESSKIYDILRRAGFEENRVATSTVYDVIPSPQYVFDMLMKFDRNKCETFAETYYQRYLNMMKNVTMLMN